MRQAIISALIVATVAALVASHAVSGSNPYATAYDADVNHDGGITAQDAQFVFSQFKAGQHPPLPTATPTSYCDLSGRTLDGMIVNPSLGGMPLINFSGCRLVNTRVGQRGGFAGVSFRDADMRGAYLDTAYLEGSDFTGANLTGATLTRIDARNGTKFVNANLTNAVLSNGTTTQTWPPDISREAFLGTDFTGAITTGADVSSVIWWSTICPDGTNSDNDGGSCIGHGFDGTPLATWTPTATATATATPVPCSGAAANAIWTAGNGHCYQRFDTLKVFADARSDCQLRGGYLVTLTSAEEQAFVWSGVWAGPYTLIGLTDEIDEGTFLWVTGEPAIYANWNVGEPNSAAGDEDAVVMALGPIAGGWNDTSVVDHWPYICETP